MLKKSLAAILFAVTCYTEMPVALAQTAAPEDPIKALGNLLSNILQPRGAEFRELITRSKYQEAAEYWAREKMYFDSRQQEYAAELDAIAKNLNEKLEAEISPALERLQQLTAEPHRWSDLSNERKTITDALARYERLAVLAETRRTSAMVGRAKQVIASFDRALVAYAPDALASYDLFSGRSFFQEYPASLPNGFLSAHFDSLQASLDVADKTQLATFSRTYEDNLSTREREQLGSLYIRGSNGSPGSVLSAVAEAAKLHLAVPADSNVKVLNVTTSSGSSEQAFPIIFRTDVKIADAVVGQAELDTSSLEGGRYVVVLRTVEEAIDRKITARDSFASRYIASQRTLPNPVYEQARLRYLHAEAEAQQAELRNSLNPPRGAIAAILQGVASGVAAAGREKAYQEFAAISPTITEPVYATYKVQTATVKVAKTATIGVMLLDTERRLVSETSYPISEEKEFTLAYDIRQDDEDRGTLLRRYQSETDVEAFEKQAGAVSFGDVVGLFDGTESTRPYTSTEQLLASMQLPSRQIVAARAPAAVANADDPRFSSVVIVKAGNSLGAGFYIADNLVITNNHVVETAGFAELRLWDGREIYAKVIKRDVDADLALLRAAADVPALPLSDSPIRAGQRVEAVGHPEGLSYSLTSGIVSAIRSRPVPGMRTVTLIQTDAAINPGNSGGPLLDGQKVVGINTLRFKNAQGIGFAVHADEIRRFIKQQP